MWQRVRTDPVSRTDRMQALLDALPPPPEAPVNTVLPTISGEAFIGQIWTATTGTWTGSPAPTYTYQWFREAAAISGATASTYVLQDADSGVNISVVVTATNAGGAVSAQSDPSLIPAGMAGTSNATGTVAGGAITFVADGGAPGSAPAAPTPGALVVAYDFDFGDEAVGAFPTVVPRAGTETGARAVIGGDAPTIGTLANGRRAAFFDGVNDWVQITGGLGPFALADAEFTVAVVVWRDTASVTQGVWSVTKGIQSGASTVNRYDMFFTSANAHLWRRADAAATTADATFAGAPSTTAPNIYVLRGSTSAPDQRNRGMHNGATKVQSAALTIPVSPFPFVESQIGARMISNPVARSQFLHGKIERLIVWSGSATDGDMDDIQTALAAYYTV